MAKVPNAIDILPKISTAWIGCTSVIDDRQTTDGRATANSERSLKTVINNTQLKQYAFHNDDYVSINALKKLETQISAFKCYRNVELFIWNN